MDSKFEFLYDFYGIENDIEFKEICNKYELDVTEVIKKLESNCDLKQLKLYVYDKVYENDIAKMSRLEDDIKQLHDKILFLKNQAIEKCPAFANIVGGGGTRMKMRNIPKHYAKCSTCENYMKMIDEMSNKLNEAQEQFYLIYDKNNYIKKIIETFVQHFNKYKYKCIILNGDNIEKIYFTIKGSEIKVSLEDIFESITMNDAQKSFYNDAQKSFSINMS